MEPGRCKNKDGFHAAVWATEAGNNLIHPNISGITPN